MELLVALGIGALVLTAIYSTYGGLTRSYTTQNVAADMQQVMRAGIDFMVEDIIQAGLNPEEAPGFGIAVATSTSIRFTADRNMNGTPDAADFEEITYSYNAAANRLDQCLYETIGAADCAPFIDDVTALTISYLDGTGIDLGDPVSAANLSNIRSIAISLTVQKPAGREGMVARTYSTRFRCRNLGI
jgi:type II secretory pathway component PulJ